MKDKMISFIVPFFTIEKDKHLNLNEKEDMWPENNSSNIIFGVCPPANTIVKLPFAFILLADSSFIFSQTLFTNSS